MTPPGPGPRVIGIDPGTISIDLCGLDGGQLYLDRSIPTGDALAQPAAFLALLEEGGRPDLIAGPSGYGLPLLRRDQITEQDLRLALLTADGEAGGIGGLGRLLRLLIDSSLPVIFTPGAVHLPTIPPHRKLNRIDLGTADKVAAVALGLWRLGDATAGRLGGSAAGRIDTQGQPHGVRTSDAAEPPSFILLELGGAFTAALAVENGAIIDGIGGTAGPMGWRSGGGWDGETAFLAGSVTKEMLFRGGRIADDAHGLAGYVEGAHKAVLALTAALPAPAIIFLSGRHAADPEVRAALDQRLQSIAPVHDLLGFATTARQGAQGAALIADGLAGGGHRWIVEAMRLSEATGTVLDWLRVITPEAGLRRLGRL